MKPWHKKVGLYMLIGCGVFLISSYARAQEVNVTDQYKTVVNQSPYVIEACYQKQVSGDRTLDTLTGAIIGGVIGHQIGSDRSGNRNVGAILGGIIGNNNSKANGGYRTVCQQETRYRETQQTIYSHSIARFKHEGRWYNVNFTK
mgnify:CR=1 FL=1